MRLFMDIAKALADETRVRILAALRRQELCVCQIVELAQLAPSTVSKHMTVLRQARLVDSRKEGRWIYYRLADTAAPSAVQEGLTWVWASLRGDSRIKEDKKKLQSILKMGTEQLCKKQNQR